MGTASGLIKPRAKSPNSKVNWDFNLWAKKLGIKVFKSELLNTFIYMFTA